jgi:hypothetical protein
MQIINKPLIIGGHKCGSYEAYVNIPQDFVPTDKGTRVIPAPFLHDKGIQFALAEVHAPGAPFFPNGGYTLREQTSGGVYSYDLDQVIKWPETAQAKRVVRALADGEETEQSKRGRRSTSTPKVKVPGGRRGRPAMDPALKAALEAEKVARTKVSGGRRGRPANPDRQPKPAYVPTGGVRGRKPLSPEVKAARAGAGE